MSRLTLIEKSFYLKKTEAFQELDLDLALAIANKAEELAFEKDERIFSLNQEAHRLYIILEGNVLIADEREKKVTTLYPYDYFGDESLFSQKPRMYNAIAETKVKLLTISRTHLVEIILESPNIALCLLRAYAQSTPFRNRFKEENQ